MDNSLFQLRFTSKQLNRLSQKAERDSAAEKAKVQKALKTNNVDTARIYAENAIRKHHESVNYLRLSARIDAVASRVQTAVTMKQVTKNLEGVTKELERAMAGMQLEKVEKIMEKFEKQFENLDVHTATMEGAMSSATATSTPENDVVSLMRQVADENGLDINAQLAEMPSAAGSIVAPAAAAASASRDDDLSSRLRALRE
jgi:charged multivesicular body protein 1